MSAPTVTLAFTASPWEADRAKADRGGSSYHQIDAVDSVGKVRSGADRLPLSVGDTLSRHDSILPDEDRANALLLAAAPELALALLAGLGIEGLAIPSGNWEEIARSALKKAGVLG